MLGSLSRSLDQFSKLGDGMSVPWFKLCGALQDGWVVVNTRLYVGWRVERATSRRGGITLC